MKKIYAKVTAVVLASAMILTTANTNPLSVSAGNLTQAEANAAGWDYGFDVDICDKSVSYLDEAFDVYKYKLASSQNVGGPYEPSAKNDTYIGEGEFTHFTTSTFCGSTSKGGLKPSNILPNEGNEDGHTDGSGYTTLTYTKESMNNFKAEYEFFSGEGRAYGLAFGGAEAGLFPVSLDSDKSNDTGVALYMEASGTLQVYGAIDSNTATGTGGVGGNANTWVGWLGGANGNSVAGTRRFTEMTGGKTLTKDTTVTADSETFTVCVEVQDGVLKVYEKGYPERVATIQLTENYQGGYVSLFANAVDQGSFKSFKIKKTDPEPKWDYEAQIAPFSSVSYLDDAFEVYQFAKPSSSEAAKSVVGPVKPSEKDPNGSENASYFTTSWYGQTGIGGLKPAFIQGGNGSGGYTNLTYNQTTMINFKAEYEVYGGWGTPVGLVFGAKEKTVFPITCDGNSENDTGVAVYMENDGAIFVYGALNSANVKTEGNAVVASTSWGNYVNGTTALKLTGMTDGATMAVTNSSAVDTATLTVCVEVQDGILTVYEKAHDSNKVSIELADTYTGGYVSFFGTHAQHYSFKSFGIKKTPDPEFVEKDFTIYDFTTMDLTKDVNRLFESYHFEKDKEVVAGVPTEQWTTSQNPSGSTAANFQNWKLKPRNASEGGIHQVLLSLKDQQVKNFEAKVEYLIHWTEYGLVIAPRGEQANEFNGVQIDVASDGSIRIKGAIDAGSAVWSGVGEPKINNTHSLAGPALSGYVNPDANNSNTNKTMYQLHVKVQDGKLTAGIEGFEGELTVNLTANYAGGSISLYSIGSNQGGFNSFAFKELKNTDPVETTVKAVWEQIGDGVAVTLFADHSYSNISGTIRFNAETYTYAGEQLYESSLTENVDGSASVDGNTLTFSVTGNDAGKYVTYLFEGAALDKNQFTLNASTRGVADVKNAIEMMEVVSGDVTDDKLVDVKDLVRLKKYASDNSITINKANSDLDGTGTYTEDENFNLMRKTLLGIGSVQIL